MKFIESFEKFITDEVNLNKTRLDRITAGIDTVKTFLGNSKVFGDQIKSVEPQGSYRQKTIIKPATEDVDFDVDLLCEMKLQAGWQPKDYPDRLHNEFKKTDRYKDIVDKRGKNRCVTLDYADDFHIDLVPAVTINGSTYIMNRKDNRFEPTDGDGYAQWFAGKNTKAGNDYLVLVCRILKYVRDRQEIPIKSVLLTTILGNLVLPTDGPTTFPDLPTTLRILLGRLDGFFQAQNTMPVITNPSLPSENFNRHWDNSQFQTCRKAFHTLRAATDEAYLQKDREQSVEQWRKVFGQAFPIADADLDESAAAEAEFSLGTVSHCQPVSAIPGFRGEMLDPKVKIRIDGYVYSRNGKIRLRGINTSAKLGNNLSIRYVASTNAKEPYEVYWQVVNTGEHARRENGLRGNFFRAKAHGGTLNSNKLSNWEYSKYKGLHWIEAFVVKDGYLIARSGRFYVHINNPSF